MKKRRNKKLISIIIAIVILFNFTGCTQFYNNSLSDGVFRTGMATDTGGINDQSFNQSAWEGMKKLRNDYGDKVQVSYLESNQETDFAPNLDRLVDKGNEFVWAIGFGMADAILQSASTNPEVNFAIVDNYYQETPENVTGVMFKAQEGAFLVGYIAGKTTKTDKVGFVGGVKGETIDQFDYGYKAGVDYASYELDKKIDVVTQYTDSFSDTAKGKAVAQKMYTLEGCDIVFHAAGGCGMGVITAAEENNAFAIGVDQDQSYLSPNHVLTSSLKKVSKAVEDLSVRLMNGEDIAGKTIIYGVKEDAVGIPEEHHLMSEETYSKAIMLQQKISKGEIIVPHDLGTYKNFDVLSIE